MLPLGFVLIATLGRAPFSFSTPLIFPVSPAPEGDRAFLERHDPDRAREALTLYRFAREKDPQNAEAAWRVAMACQFIGLRLEKDPDKARTYYAEGQEAGQASLAGSQDCAPCYFWTAINMALYGESVGAFKMLFSVGEIRDHLKRSAQLDPLYASAGATRILGIIEWKLPGLLGGSDTRARAYFEQALKLIPGEPLTTTFLVKLLEQEFSETELAQELADAALRLPRPPSTQIESQEAYDELSQRPKPRRESVS